MRANRALYPIATMCRVLGVSSSGYYAWHRRAPCARSCADQALTERIQAIHERSRQTYGVPRVHAPSWRLRESMWAASGSPG